MNKRQILSLLLILPSFVMAQTGADFMVAMKKANATVPFDITAKGDTFRVKWGMDTAWDWDYNVNRGINFIGKGNFETGRVSFQPIDLVTDNGDGTLELSSRQKYRLQKRISMIKTTGTNVVNLNCDHEVLFKLVNNQGYCQEADDPTGKNNYQGKPEEWYKLIKATTQYCQKQGLTVVSVSPFNESDFVNWQQYKGNEANGMKDFLEIAKLIKQDPFFNNIRVCGGNTLNCDRALPWYNYLKEYLDEGNTHQLAGSFDTYANFFATVKKDGKIGTADELHNVGEAIVGVQYGMQNGIWWGFDSKARGQFCLDSNEGVRLGYGESRGTWTSAAVYRNDKTGEVHGYIGSSERQANNASYAFVSTAKNMYVNGYGPTRMWVRDIKGGTGYQQGQINAEYYFDVITSEDVPQCEVNDTFAIVNASTKNVLRWNGQNRVTPASVTTELTAISYLWHVYPSFTDGDCSYWFIDNISPSSVKVNLNVQNNNLRAGAGLICWDAGHNATEQWLLKYAGDGYYYIISRLSNMYLKDSGSAVTLENAPAADASATVKKAYMWRFQKKGTKTEFTKPKAPTKIVAKQRPGSIELTWTASTSNDISCYNVARAELVDGAVVDWQTIGRNITGTVFTDNTASPIRKYAYKLVGVDNAGNRSNASDTIHAACIPDHSLLCQIQFDDSLKDASANKMSASLYGSETYNKTSKKSGTKSFVLNGSSYMMLPYGVADQDEMTITAWVYMSGTGNWQRLFDFCNDNTHYMFYSPIVGSEQRFVFRNGGDEEILSFSGKMSTSTWRHVAITIKPVEGSELVEASVYIDGALKATKSDFTIRPSDIRPGLCFIGRSIFDSDPLFNGRIDDFRIYNYALSAEQVAAVKNDTEGLASGYEDIYVSTDGETGIQQTPATSSDASVIYDLQGRRVNSVTSPGIYIQNGRKILKK